MLQHHLNFPMKNFINLVNDYFTIKYVHKANLEKQVVMMDFRETHVTFSLFSLLGKVCF